MKKLYGGKPRIKGIAFSPDEERILVIGDENTVNIYDLSEATLQITFPGGPDSIIGGIAWSPDGQQIGAALPAEMHPVAKIWDAKSGDEVMMLKGHEAQVWMIVWDPSGAYIATTSDDRTIRVWDAETGDKNSFLRSIPRTR